MDCGYLCRNLLVEEGAMDQRLNVDLYYVASIRTKTKKKKAYLVCNGDMRVMQGL